MPEFLKFTDEEGDPIYVKNDVIGIYTKTERVTVTSYMEGALRSAKTGPEVRGIISQSTGQWAVRETYNEILDEIDRVTACESSA